MVSQKCLGATGESGVKNSKGTEKRDEAIRKFRGWGTLPLEIFIIRDDEGN